MLDEPSEEDFRNALRSGIILCNALNKIQPGAVPKVCICFLLVIINVALALRIDMMFGVRDVSVLDTNSTRAYIVTLNFFICSKSQIIMISMCFGSVSCLESMYVPVIIIISLSLTIIVYCKVVEAPSDIDNIPDGAALSVYQYFENVRNFLVTVEQMGLPTFEASDLEQVL